MDERLLAELPPQAQVWRRSGPGSLQEGIHWLIQRCREGKQVVHLKSGDPLIFGRAREEIQALREAGCPLEIWPGLSSALAGPLWAGIPLTDKHLSRVFAVLTAHDLEALPWSALAELQQGESQAKLPGLLVVGEVIRLRQDFLPGIPPLPPPAPLAGKTVLVTRSEGQSPAFRELLQAQGARVLEMPTLVIQPPTSWDPLDTAIANLEQFDWLLLTSANGVQAFFERLQRQGRDSRALHSLQVAVVGSKTASVLAQYGIRPDLMPSEFVAEALLPIWPQPVQGQRILFPRVESGGREELVQGLRQRGAEVVEVAAYQSACPATADPQVVEALKARQVDILTFASSKTVQHFAHLIRQSGLGPEVWDPPVQIAAIGPKTAATCKAAFGRVDIAAQEYTLEGLVEALIQATNRST